MSYPPLPLAQLPAALRNEAEFLERFGPEAAEAFAYCAEWLDVCLAAHLDERLTLKVAAGESGWSYEGLRRRLEEVPALNAGKPGAPLIRRRDLQQLGAPRGPRGPYGPRKQKGDSAPEAASEVNTQTPAGNAPESAHTQDVHLDGPAPAPVPAAAETVESDESEANASPAATDERRRGTGKRRRTGSARTRRPTASQRFGELLVRAALG